MARPAKFSVEEALEIIKADRGQVDQAKLRLANAASLARERGASLRQIAEAAGMTPEGVRLMLKR